MELIVEPISTDVTLNVVYKEAAISLIEPAENRVPLIRKFLKDFDLRMDDIKFNQQTLSGNFIHFAKSYDSAFFDVSFGLEEASARLWKAEDKNQAFYLFGKLFQVLGEIPLASLKISINQQLSSEGDLASFFKPFDVNCPKAFKPLLTGRGRQYNLRIPDHNLTIYVNVANSLFLEKGLFLGIDSLFIPPIHDYENLTETLKKYYEFVLTALGIKVLIEE